MTSTTRADLPLGLGFVLGLVLCFGLDLRRTEPAAAHARIAGPVEHRKLGKLIVG